MDGTAIAGSDYTETSGTLSFGVGVTEQTISVPTLNDTVPEFEENFTVVLSNSVGVGLGDAIGEGTITDDELPKLSIGNTLGRGRRNGRIRGEVDAVQRGMW